MEVTCSVYGSEKWNEEKQTLIKRSRGSIMWRSSAGVLTLSLGSRKLTVWNLMLFHVAAQYEEDWAQ